MRPKRPRSTVQHLPNALHAKGAHHEAERHSDRHVGDLEIQGRGEGIDVQARLNRSAQELRDALDDYLFATLQRKITSHK